jgi:glutamyl-tRNA synthetase
MGTSPIPSRDGRFAPSPSGPFHVGNLRTAMVAWLFARSAGARFLLRIDDLDRRAARGEHERGQISDLVALGIDWDGPVVRQSERFHLYRDAIRDLTEAGLTYACYCSRREVREAASAPHVHLPEGAYPGTCRDLDSLSRSEREASGRPAALRIRADATEVTFLDRLHGSCTGVVDDFVVRRNDGTPAYNLAVVIDDAAQGVGEVVRGDDLLAGTPRHLFLAEVLSVTPPTYAHVPLVVGPDGERLSKSGLAITLDDLRAEGHSVAEVRSALAQSLNLADPLEPVTMSDLLARFDPRRLPIDPWVFRGL